MRKIGNDQKGGKKIFRLNSIEIRTFSIFSLGWGKKIALQQIIMDIKDRKGKK
jgi:hypothetical protein